MNGPRIEIHSFSYHSDGIPVDATGHGGGFVFDCRGLPNPGREARFLPLTGRDPEVIACLESAPEVESFLAHAVSLVTATAASYRARGFTNLFVAFGCTGGRHRSVYCAERMHGVLRDAGYDAVVVHDGRDRW